jgi:hypothetical protein
VIAIEQRARLAATMYECRDAARSLLGDRYAARMAEIGKAIDAISTARRIGTVAAATLMARNLDGMNALQVIAAAVELVEPTPEHST